VSVLSGNLRPGFFNYPSLFMYALGIADAGYCAAAVLSGTHPSIEACAASWRTGWEPFFLIARLVSAAAGIATVLLVYVLGTRLFDNRTGLASAAFLSVVPLHVRDSHFGVTDVSMTMLLMLAVVLLVAAHDRASEAPGSLRRFAGAGLVAGLATSTKYNALLLVAPAITAVVLLWSTDTDDNTEVCARRVHRLRFSDTVWREGRLAGLDHRAGVTPGRVLGSAPAGSGRAVALQTGASVSRGRPARATRLRPAGRVLRSARRLRGRRASWAEPFHLSKGESTDGEVDIRAPGRYCPQAGRLAPRTFVRALNDGEDNHALYET
jgi:Dolichyl-phosphate-mannose-protein mannosyltransferase